MKCELVAALLHGPSVLFLDELMIGMDVTTQHAVREFIRSYNKDEGATVVLTSHYMQDVAALCRRIIVIDGGCLAFNGDLDALRAQLQPLRRVRLRLDEGLAPGTRSQLMAVAEAGSVVEHDDRHLVIDIQDAAVAGVVSALLKCGGTHDLSIQEAPLEELMRTYFARNKSTQDQRKGL